MATAKRPQTGLRGRTSQLKTASTQIKSKPGIASVRKVSFGSVTVEAPYALKEQIKRNVDESAAALRRAGAVFKSVGVKLNTDKSVPLYRADPNSPDLLIRTMNGKTVRGSMIEGRFVPIK